MLAFVYIQMKHFSSFLLRKPCHEILMLKKKTFHVKYILRLVIRICEYTRLVAQALRSNTGINVTSAAATAVRSPDLGKVTQSG